MLGSRLRLVVDNGRLDRHNERITPVARDYQIGESAPVRQEEITEAIFTQQCHALDEHDVIVTVEREVPRHRKLSSMLDERLQ